MEEAPLTRQEAEMERALSAAAADPAARPDFYQLLLSSEICFVAQSENPASGTRTLTEAENIRIQYRFKDDGTKVIPFYTSVAALQRNIHDEVHFMRLDARLFFETTLGSALVLNPGSDFGKEFTPDEIAALLKGGSNRDPETCTVEKSTRVFLSQPASYPVAMTDALARYFMKRPQVEAAYLIQMLMPPETVAHLVVGLVANGDIQRISREAAAVAAESAKHDRQVDLYFIKQGDPGISSYCIDETKPFYARIDTHGPEQHRDSPPGRAGWLERLLSKWSRFRNGRSLR